MLVTVDMEALRIVRAEGNMVLEGECNRCGKCCQGMNVPYPKEDGLGCKHLVQDQVNDGEPIYRCDIYRRRPVGCALSPTPDEEMPEECGLKWEEQS